jgi:hypothetical protein
VLQNAGEQSVTWDTRGITVTDKQSPSNQLRLVGGAILMREMGEDGVERWVTALTNKGISASHIRSGKLDTNVLQIMNGDQATFRWDSYGLTAYDFNLIPGLSGDIITAINPNRGVRFDRFGLYGFEKSDSTVWHPKNIAEIRKNSTFMATWDGFEFRKGGYGHLGNAGDGILLAVGKNKGEPTFSVTAEGKITANDGDIGGWSIAIDRLSNGEFDTEDSIHLIPKGNNLNRTQFLLADNDAWVITAGKNFGVTKKGILYAKDAKISGEI